MYSPKIKERHIPTLYKLSKAKGMPMTKLVNQIISDYLAKTLAEELIKNGKEKTKQVDGSPRDRQMSV